MGFLELMMRRLKLKQSLPIFAEMHVLLLRGNQKYFWSKLAVAIDRIGYLSRATVSLSHVQAHLFQLMLIFWSVLPLPLVTKATGSQSLVLGSFQQLWQFLKSMQKGSILWIWCWESTIMLQIISAKQASSKYPAKSACWEGKCILVQNIINPSWNAHDKFCLCCVYECLLNMFV